ncbi:MAG: hypothetical protein LBN10_00900 [Propionibacteriaceae bacterium]|jgi:hypothetical protein|nr:hypothetical protein [Propionibacteriaceae bacterium]
MTVTALIDEAVGLRVREKLDLIEAVWQSLQSADDIPDEVELEAARRALREYQSNPERVPAWDTHWEKLNLVMSVAGVVHSGRTLTDADVDQILWEETTERHA